MIPLYGHDQLRHRFDAAVERGALPGSLLLHGPRGVGKQRLGLWLAQRLLCSGSGRRPCGVCEQCRFAVELTHPDLHWFFPRPRLKDGEASASEIREDHAEAVAERAVHNGIYPPSAGMDGIFIATTQQIVQSAAMSPAMAQRKVYVIGDAERMVPQTGADQSANAFLKLLEEPPVDTTIVLTSSEPGALLPTVRSRVVAFRVPPLSDSAVRQVVSDPAMQHALRDQGFDGSVDDLVLAAAGSPGRLLAHEAWSQALRQAHRFIEAASGSDRSSRYEVALGQGVSRARGAFSDTLDAVATLLHERARAASVRRDEAAAVGAARAVLAVERAKEQAEGNLNPQLVSAALLRQLSGLLQ
ncbi:MAG TPA: hypothetical protein VJU87_04805 [Gemmatimonadaceae bacterium]|nr:hypothetical protein [Gemmatimonadaceae bacterium]